MPTRGKGSRMFEGLSVALVTPFTGGALDEPAIERLVEFVVGGGADVLVLAGSTGEAATLTRDERRRFYDIVKSANAGRARLVASTGTNVTKDSIELTQEAQAMRFDGVMLVVPYYNKPTPAGQVAHFSAIARATDLPIMLYNVPSRTGTNMTPDTIARVAELPNVVALKEASGSVDQASNVRARTDIMLLSGDDSLTLPMLAIGARGIVSVVGNVAPKPMKDLLDAFTEGRLLDAQAQHFKLLPLMHALFLESNPAPAKSLLCDMGICANELRLPLVPVEPKTAEAVRKAAATAGVQLKTPVEARA